MLGLHSLQLLAPQAGDIYTPSMTPAAGTDVPSHTHRSGQELASSPCSMYTEGQCEYGQRESRKDLMGKYEKIGQTVVIRRRTWPDKCTDRPRYTWPALLYPFKPFPTSLSLLPLHIPVGLQNSAVSAPSRSPWLSHCTILSAVKARLTFLEPEPAVW